MTTTHRDDLGPNTEVFTPATVPSSYAVSPDFPASSPGGDDRAPETGSTAPAVRAPTWSGRKTAIAAALAIGLSGAGAVAASALVPTGTGAQTGGGPGGQMGGGPAGGFGRGGQLAPPGQQLGRLGRQGLQVQPGQADPNAGTDPNADAAVNATTGTSGATT